MLSHRAGGSGGQTRDSRPRRRLPNDGAKDLGPRNLAIELLLDSFQLRRRISIIIRILVKEGCKTDSGNAKGGEQRAAV